ncbi:MAG: hypothetical protein IPK64_19605 [bacterium]|nr:hypothetical protein [bacterium]
MRIDFVPGVSPQPVQTPGTAAPRVQPTGDNGEQDAMMRGAAIGLRLGEQWKDNIDRAALTEADNRMAESVRETMQDPEKGYLSTVGKNAVGDTRRRAEGLLKERREAIESALSASQREQFAEIANRRQQRAFAAMDEHEQHQGRVWAMGETEARAKSIGQDAVAAWGTQEWPVMHGSLLTAIDDYADLAGIGDEGKKALRSAATTELHGHIVERLVGRGMTKEAQAHLAQYRDEVAPDKAGALGQLVAQADEEQTGIRMALQLGRGLPSLQQQHEALAADFEAGKITTDVYKTALSHLRANDQERRAGRSQARSDAREEFQAWAQQNRTKADWALRMMPTAMSQKLDDLGLLEESEQWLQQGGQWITTEAGLYASLNAEQMVGSFKSRQQAIDAMRPQMDDRTLAAFMDRYDRATRATVEAQARAVENYNRSVAEAAAAASKSYVNLDEDELLKESMIANGIAALDPDGKVQATDTLKALQWRNAMRERVAAKTRGRHPTSDDWREAGKELSANYVETRAAGKVYFFQRPTQEQRQESFVTVPDGRQIEARRMEPYRDDILKYLDSLKQNDPQQYARVVPTGEVTELAMATAFDVVLGERNHQMQEAAAQDAEAARLAKWQEREAWRAGAKPVVIPKTAEEEAAARKAAWAAETAQRQQALRDSSRKQKQGAEYIAMQYDGYVSAYAGIGLPPLTQEKHDELVEDLIQQHGSYLRNYDLDANRIRRRLTEHRMELQRKK